MTRFWIEAWSVVLGALAIVGVLGAYGVITALIYRATGEPGLAVCWPLILGLCWLFGSPLNRFNLRR